MNFLNLLNEIISLEPVNILLKLILIYILSGFIGLERANMSKPAGFRTHVLLGISAVLTVICGEKIGELSGSSDYSRIPAQLLSGIGFLGAGTILSDGFNVKGLTTAASLLAVTCIGLCVGAGLYLTAIMATAVVYIVLTHSRFISKNVKHYIPINLKINTKDPKATLGNIQEIIDRFKIEIQEMEIIRDEDGQEYVRFEGKHRDEINKNQLISEIVKIDEVDQVVEIS